MKLIKTIFFNSLFFLCLLAVGKILASDLPSSQSEFLPPDEAFVMSHEIINDKHVKINWKIHPNQNISIIEKLNKDL